jgi:hypothetical protein
MPQALGSSGAHMGIEALLRATETLALEVEAAEIWLEVEAAEIWLEAKAPA